MAKLLILLFILGISITSHAQINNYKTILGITSLKFKEKKVASESYESVGVFDVDGDAISDIVSGSYWYVGPEYQQRHFIGASIRYGEYWDDFSTIPMDINGDGKLDFITGGWWGNTIRWRENPGNGDEWKEHIISETGNVEITSAWDVDGDGLVEIVPNNPGKPLRIYKLDLDAQKKGMGTFKEHEIYETQGHGLGFGDINGDGRGDFIISSGWLEAPKNIWSDKWIFHPEFELGTAGIPIIVTDLTGDGFNDIIVGQGHSYGLDWYEQIWNKKTNKRSWKKNAIDPYNSQYHTMQWVDLDNDGKNELVTGKRFRAHNDKDDGPYDPLGIYYFRWNGSSFSKQVIKYQTYESGGKGTGISFQVTDLNKDGRKDIILAGKDGLSIFYNEGY